MDADGSSVTGQGGGGGSGLGGAIFVRSGLLQLIDCTLAGNSAAAGAGAPDAPDGAAKGGAIFLCSAEICGSRNDAVAVWFGAIVFRENSADTAGQICPARDDADVCGRLASAMPARLAVSAPATASPGAPFRFTIAALDSNNMPVPTYTGRVRLESTDSKSLLPADAQLSHGIGEFSATMNTAGYQTITAADAAAGLRGTSSPITVTPADSAL
jgi:hypothetical protein